MRGLPHSEVKLIRIPFTLLHHSDTRTLLKTHLWLLFCNEMKSFILVKRLPSKQKASEREDPTMRKRKKRTQLAVWTEQGGMEFIEVFEPAAIFQGTRRSYQKGQAMKRFKEVESIVREVRKGKHPSSHILERDDGRGSQGADRIHS